jgi:hypothetical protein
MRRRLGLPLALALLALCLAPRASAQEPLTELWSEYPLYQLDKQPAAQAAEPESRSAQEPETLPAPEPEAPVPAGQERSGEGSTEAIGPTADGPETLPWMLIAPLTWATIMLTLLLARLIPAPTVPLYPTGLAIRVVRLAVVTRERGRRGPARRGGRRGPRPTPRLPPAGTQTPPPARGPDLEEDEEEEEELLPAALAHWAGEVGREEDAAIPAPEEEEQLEFCAIEWWHGYVKSHFYARALRPDGRLYVAARSPKFLWRQGGAPEPTKSARAAHAAIVEQLAQEGWELSRAEGCDWAWYAACFSRERPESLGDLLERLEDS